ncbi:MAG: hypothetical protein ACI8XO_000845 [Verrucomicrobiales bacterium]|jgi:hypothetical protein
MLGRSSNATRTQDWQRDGVAVESVGVIDPATGRMTVVLRLETMIDDTAREFMRLAVELYF